MIGEQIQVRMYADGLQIWYAQRHVETLPRLRGAGKHQIQYRHVIDGLVCKPGAFEPRSTRIVLLQKTGVASGFVYPNRSNAPRSHDCRSPLEPHFT